MLALLVVGLASPLHAQQSGWHYSPLPGEGDRATMGCDTTATPAAFVCIAVRCEDDFTTGVYVHTNRLAKQGDWRMTIDRENATLTAGASSAPYSARFVPDQTGWLLERIRQGSFIYLRNLNDPDLGFARISLGGSLYAINNALAFCAPRTAPSDAAGRPR
jgi:hypothetical protein